MTHDELVVALRGILEQEGHIAPAPLPPEPVAGEPTQCKACGLQHLVTVEGLCPNNNCPRHYRSYPAFRAATGQIIPELEAPFGSDEQDDGA